LETGFESWKEVRFGKYVSLIGGNGGGRKLSDLCYLNRILVFSYVALIARSENVVLVVRSEKYAHYSFFEV
jgi:hypothetical protein